MFCTYQFDESLDSKGVIMATKKPAKKAAKKAKRKTAGGKPKGPDIARIRKAMNDVRKVMATHKTLEPHLKKVKAHIQDMDNHIWGFPP